MAQAALKILVALPLVGTLTLLSGCGGSSGGNRLPNASGIYRLQVEDFHGRGPATLMFSFHRTANDLEGGMRILARGSLDRARYKAEHDVRVLPDGSIAGTVDLGGDLGLTEFKGRLTQTAFSFTLRDQLGVSTGTAPRVAAYVLPIQGGPSAYVGNYSGNVQPNVSPPVWSGSGYGLQVTGAQADGVGGYELTLGNAVGLPLQDLAGPLRADIWSGDLVVVGAKKYGDGTEVSVALDVQYSPNEQLPSPGTYTVRFLEPTSKRVGIAPATLESKF